MEMEGQKSTPFASTPSLGLTSRRRGAELPVAGRRWFSLGDGRLVINNECWRISLRCRRAEWTSASLGFFRRPVVVAIDENIFDE